ncbi:hypothetical protein AB0L71_06755 [Streptomyces sp. NPDC052052]|uniref:hypothetical protein n=1 Tax=Streptomyces sp. NPDC052052 TaxID=3154756 RepID=UPI00342151D0
MRGDETQRNSTGEDPRPRSGPRHAAPRKSLLTKLHIPAGKAFALAAMPTAVFVGMGLTPKLALADDSTDIPFAPGPCVTRSDEPSESLTPSASQSTSSSATDSGDKADEATPEPSATPSASDAAKAEAKSVAAAAPTASASASPTATKSTNPLDPLGVGDALKKLFEGAGTDTATPSPGESTASETPTADATTEDASTEAAAEGAAEKTSEKASAKTAAAIRAAADKAGQTVEELDENAKGLDAKQDEDIPDGAKESFPCPTADPAALAAADLETGIPLLPTDPWILKSSMLTLNGLDYKGIVEVKTQDGTVKKVLKFTASSVDIKNLHQLTKGPNGTTAHVEARKGSTSTIREGTVTMYTEELKGNLFGLIPITFSPEAPPPLNVPVAFFTDVTVTQAGQFGGSLKVPGLQNYFTGGTTG